MYERLARIATEYSSTFMKGWVLLPIEYSSTFMKDWVVLHQNTVLHV